MISIRRDTVRLKPQLRNTTLTKSIKTTLHTQYTCWGPSEWVSFCSTCLLGSSFLACPSPCCSSCRTCVPVNNGNIRALITWNKGMTLVLLRKNNNERKAKTVCTHLRIFHQASLFATLVAAQRLTQPTMMRALE